METVSVTYVPLTSPIPYANVNFELRFLKVLDADSLNTPLGHSVVGQAEPGIHKSALYD